MKKLALIFTFLFVSAMATNTSIAQTSTTPPKPQYVLWCKYTGCCITYGLRLQIYICNGGQDYACRLSEYVWYAFKGFKPPFSL